MLVKQLSVFMENRPGRLYKLTHALGKVTEVGPFGFTVVVEDTAAVAEAL